jgi:hypothetical protein
MTDFSEPAQSSPGSALNDRALDGHTVAELSAYLDRGREPIDPSIESSPGAQNALAALSRLRAIAPKILEAEAEAAPPRNEGWITRVLDQIGVQAHAGRNIPLSHAAPTARLFLSEGAVRAIVREVGDDIDGLVVERCRLEGDVEQAGEPVVVNVRVSVFSDVDTGEVVKSFRGGVLKSLEMHTELNISDLIVQVRNAELHDEQEARPE